MNAADRAAFIALEGVVADARAGGDGRPSFVILSAALAALGAPQAAPRAASVALVAQRCEAWLRRLEGSGRSASTHAAYRIAINDLAEWAAREERAELDERLIVDYLHGYRQRCEPAPATYHRRFILLRRYLRWIAQSDHLSDPFLGLQAPPKPSQQSDWLTPEEFARLLAGAARPRRNRPGLAARDRLVLLTLVTTGLRRSELIALDWCDLALEDEPPSLLVRHGKGDRARRQPLPRQLAAELAALRTQRRAGPPDPVFCGLAGGRLSAKVLAAIVQRATERAGVEKHVTVHTLRHTAATWLRQGSADTRLVAEYLGHADLSTVGRYAHVGDEELQRAAEALAHRAGVTRLTHDEAALVSDPTAQRPGACERTGAPASVVGAVGNDAGRLAGRPRRAVANRPQACPTSSQTCR